VTALGRGAFRVESVDGRHTLGYAAADGGRTWVFIDGQTFVVEPPRTRRSAGGHDDASLGAPMPATVTRIHVAAGQTVATGDPLVTLEAMKMELAIKSPRNATVMAVNCHAGDLVQPGVALITLSDPEHDASREVREA
jgi:3-methylcrotonyl-CoA carboxylase alpha subunit